LDGVRVTVKPGVALFAVKSNFLALKPQRHWLDIEIILDEPLDVFPVRKVVQASKHKFALLIRVDDLDEVKEQLWDGY